MERLRSTFGRLNTTLIGMTLIGLAIALMLVPRFTTAPQPPAPQVARPAAAAGPEQPLPPPAPRPAEPDHPRAEAPQPPAPHAQPERVPPPPSQLRGWLDWIAHWLALTGGTTLLACLALIGLLLWRSWSLRERDIAT